MKTSVLLLLFTALLALIAQAQEKHLFILSGQSNMQGLDPDASFTPAVEKEFGADKVIVVKDAKGGRPIRDWYKDWKPADGKDVKGKNGELYDRLMEKVNSAIKGQKLASVTFVWMQGERDAREQHGEVYAESLKGLIKQLEKDLGRDDVNFVIGRLSDMDMENKRYKHWTLVREAQVKVAEESDKGAWIDTDDLPMKKDNLHYAPEGYAAMGERFAEKAIELIRK
ncbi:MAG: sialate O-acetylesterase [Akkermansiaceae bacterium]|nr:sialate O-acetylesterase [Akkermansiaceae bacterium]